jgi:hypothetical protein
MTKIFKISNIRIALSANNTIEKLLTTKQEQVKSKYDKSGVYQLKCPTCNMKYIGQTGRSFKTRFQEHLRHFKYNNRKSKFAQHLLDKEHSMDKTENTMDIIHITSKGKMMDTIGKYYIYTETKLNNQINDKLTVQPHIIYGKTHTKSSVIHTTHS